MQRPPQGAVVAVFGIGDDRGQRDPRGAGSPEQRQRQAPFLVKGDGGGDPRTGAARRIARPRLGQIERGAHRPGAAPGPERRRHGHLAIGDLAQRAAVLPRDADRVGARLRKARLVEDQNAGARRRHRPQPLPQDLGVPRGMRDEVLEGLIGRRLADPRQHRRHRLARTVAQQAVDVLPQRHVLRPMTEAVLELIQPARQATQQRPGVPIEHGTAAYRTQARSTSL